MYYTRAYIHIYKGRNMEYNDNMVVDDSKCEKMNTEYLNMSPDSVARRLIGEMEAERERLHRSDEKKYTDWVRMYDDMLGRLQLMLHNTSIVNSDDAPAPMRSENEMGVSATRTRRRYPFVPFFPIFRRR